MPRKIRGSTGGICCHVLNRGNGCAEVFHGPGDYQEFVNLLPLACERVNMRLLGWCLMPNHFHLLVRPYADGDLARWMQWLMTSHVRRHHKRYGTSGHIWGGRFKSFPLQRRRPTSAERGEGVIETADPFWTVLRYIERNALRANLVEHAEDWPWSSLRWWAFPSEAPQWAKADCPQRPAQWLEMVNKPQTKEELDAVRCSVIRGRPFGTQGWVQRTAKAFGLEHTIRPLGRPPMIQKQD